jgi:hypothetical protein
MSGWFRKLKGIFSLGAIGGVLSAGVAAVWGVGSGLLHGFLVWEQVTFNTVLWGLVGAFSATAFAGLLVAFRDRKSLEEISLFHAALAGGLAGAFFPVAVTVMLSGSLTPILSASFALLGIFAAGGATVTCGMLMLAQASARKELDEGTGDPKLIE